MISVLHVNLSLVAGLALCLVAFTRRATLVVLYRGENGTAVK